MYMKSKDRIEKLFSFWTLWLCLAGLAINFILANTVIALGLPLYIDNVGSGLVAALGGPIPGMAIGFLSNVINSVNEPISMYYGIITIGNALAAAWFSKRGFLKTFKGCLGLAGVMVIIGGACGSIMTWLLYGGGIGGVAAPLATFLHNHGLSEFWAQFVGDVAIDIADKFLTVLPIYFFLRYYPKKLYNKFSLSYLYDRSEEEIEQIIRGETSSYIKTSLNKKMTRIIVAVAIFISSISIVIGMVFYQAELMNRYANHVKSISNLVANYVNGDEIDQYLKDKGTTADYRQTKKSLEDIKISMDEIEYVYVYKIEKDGCHVVFDIDSGDMKGSPCGDVLTFDEEFQGDVSALLRGEKIEPVVSNDQYGWLISGYSVIKNSEGKTVAYGCADISMERYVNNMLIYMIKILAMLFGVSLFVCSAVLWFAASKFTKPIDLIMGQTRAFNSMPEEKWLTSKQWTERPDIKTGDEIEELYHTVCNLLENTSKNVSKIKDAEKKIRQAYDIEKSNKELAMQVEKVATENAMKTEFYSRMSHDMRTPMNGIIGLVNLSEDENDLGTLKSNIKKIGDSGTYLLALINDTLDMSKIESKKMLLEEKPVKMTSLLDNISDTFNVIVGKKKLNFRTEYNDISDDYVLFDRVRLDQIVINLLSNSIKFTPDGGIIEFIVNESKNGEFNHYQIIVRDTGCGMSDKFQNDGIFKSFSQEHNDITISSAGSGLGLAIVKNIVNLMEGEIEVESKLNEGTTFTIDLNFKVVDEPKKEEHKKIPVNLDDLKGKHALVCEDHPLNMEITTKLLEKVGMVVEPANNGAIGLEKFTEASKNTFDIILMDIRMPIMDGIEATKRIRALDYEKGADIPIIAMTANAYAEDKQMTSEAGMNAHLCKPINPQELYETLITYTCK